MLRVFQSRLNEICDEMEVLRARMSSLPDDVQNSPFVDFYLSDSLKEFKLKNRALIYTHIPEIQHANRDDAKDFLQGLFAILEKRNAHESDDSIQALGWNVMQNECLHALAMING